jgi:hypothetical protein
VKFSDFLPWSLKKNGVDPDAPGGRERRHSRRSLDSGAGWVYWASATGEAHRLRITFVDSSQDPDGLGFVCPRPLDQGAMCWILPDGGAAMCAEVRHVAKTDEGYRIGANLEFQERFVEGRGRVRFQWINSERAVVWAPGSVKNSGQGLIEVGLPINIPARQMVFVEGPHYGCLAVCRGARPDGNRFILVVEAASDSFLTAAA